MIDASDFQPFPPSAPFYSDTGHAPFDRESGVDPLEAAERRRTAGPGTTRARVTADRSSNRDERPIELLLYVSSVSPHAKTALRNIRRALAQFANRPFNLTVHDL